MCDFLTDPEFVRDIDEDPVTDERERDRLFRQELFGMIYGFILGIIIDIVIIDNIPLIIGMK